MRFAKYAITAALISIFGTAHSASIASASFTQFAYSVSSTSPTQQQAGLTWGTTTPYAQYSWANTNSINTIESGPSVYSNNGPIIPGSSSVAGVIGGASSTLNGSPFDHTLGMTSTGFATGGSSLWNGAYYGTGSLLYSIPFTITPESSVTFTANAVVTTNLSEGFNLLTNGFEYAGANVWFGVDGLTALGSDIWQSEHVVLRNQAGYTLNGGDTFDWLYAFDVSGTKSSLLSLSFLNNTSDYLSGQLQITVEAYGFSSIQAEPASLISAPPAFILMLTGLGLLGFTRRNRTFS